MHNLSQSLFYSDFNNTETTLANAKPSVIVKNKHVVWRNKQKNTSSDTKPITSYH